MREQKCSSFSNVIFLSLIIGSNMKSLYITSHLNVMQVKEKLTKGR